MTVYNPTEVERLIAEAKRQYGLVEVQGYGVRAGTMHDMANQLEAARLEIDRLQHANDSLIPGAMLTATEIACLRVERDGSRAEIQRLTDAAQLSRSGAAEAVHDHDRLVNELEVARTEIERLQTELSADRLHESQEAFSDRCVADSRSKP